jgi:hypothetical protein
MHTVTAVLFGTLNNKMHTVATVLFGALNNKMHTVATVLFEALDNKMHTMTTVLFGAKQMLTCPKYDPSTIHSPGAPFHLNATQRRRTQF